MEVRILKRVLSTTCTCPPPCCCFEGSCCEYCTHDPAAEPRT